MGVGGHFWDLLKPYGRSEGFDFLRNKRVAVDLSYWIVQHETAIKGYTRNPHLRLTFFRTINLFSKFGAFPVFVVDGTPSYLKSQARMQRFYRGSGTDISSLPVPEDGVSVERNATFQKLVQECVELLELLGMPVLRASGEAEALCAQLNRDGYVDACITADSDAFLYGAKCVIKRLSPNSKEPLECYHMSDIEAGLGLKRSHLIAVSLLVGNDHDLNGVPGVGVDTALRFVKAFSADDILDRLQEIGRGDIFMSHDIIDLESDLTTEETSKRSKSPHCSVCGHPGSKRAHDKSACQYCCCDNDKGCIQKPPGFKCSCSACDLNRELKQQKNCRDWQMKVCKKIHLEQNFPNEKIIKMYMNDAQPIDEGQHMSWVDPRTDLLVDLLAYSQKWEPSYIRQRMLPLLSTIYLRDVASKQNDELLCGQYEFHSVQRLKIRFGYQLFVVKWKQAARTMTDCVPTTPRTPNAPQELGEAEELSDQLDEPEVPQVYIEDGCWFLLTDEDIELVRNAFPEKVDAFYIQKALQEEKSKRKTPKSVSQSPRGIQLSIKEFYRSTKLISKVTPQEKADGSCGKSEDSPEGKRRGRITNYSKSVRRKLLFD